MATGNAKASSLRSARRTTEHVPQVHLISLHGGPGPVVFQHASAGGLPLRRVARRVAQDFEHSAGERLHIERLYQPSDVLGHEFGKPADVIAENWDTSAQRLERRDAEALRLARQEKGVGLLEVTDEVTAFTEEAHRPLEPECAHARFNSCPLRSIPDQDQTCRDLPAHARKHLDDINNALDRAKGRYVKKKRPPGLVAAAKQLL